MLSDLLLPLTAAGGASEWAAYLGYAALIASAFFVLFGVRASQSRKDLNDSVVALQGRLDANQDEIRGLKDKNTAQAGLIDRLKEQVADQKESLKKLERVVTSRDEIAAQTRVLIEGFTALGVDASRLHRAASMPKSNGG